MQMSLLELDNTGVKDYVNPHGLAGVQNTNQGVVSPFATTNKVSHSREAGCTSNEMNPHFIIRHANTTLAAIQ